ncbi:MAG TPA: hypothetical protein VHF27_07855 [Acidimicrobiales bacterium]|nr:hypothetical protein [Acidimicrobiales bacterium]
MHARWSRTGPDSDGTAEPGSGPIVDGRGDQAGAGRRPMADVVRAATVLAHGRAGPQNFSFALASELTM